ncbi:hypothetical protein WA158_005564 [Blastocystis sp. Blastoise]
MSLEKKHSSSVQLLAPNDAEVLNTIKCEFRASVNTGIHVAVSEHEMNAYNNSIHLAPDDFEVLCVLGVGAYGKVVQVRGKKTNKIYAMKVIPKSILKKKWEREFMKTERDILTQISFPFIIKLICSFQTEGYLFILMEYCAGGELFHALRSNGFLDENQVRYYACEMILAIEHLHNLHIIHRDLKPENILLDIEGHINITDFGLAKANISDDNKTRTLCGTYEYMAPEMVAGKEYGSAVDWWSFGCLLYEMFTGFPPFRNQNTKKLYQDIMMKKIKYPSFLSHDVISLLKGLLTKDPNKRLGSIIPVKNQVGGVQQLKNHPFFKNIDWSKVLDRSIIPPYKPNYILDNHYLDTSNFFKEYTTMDISTVLNNHENNNNNQEDNKIDELFKNFSFVSNEFLGDSNKNTILDNPKSPILSESESDSDHLLRNQSEDPSLFIKSPIEEINENTSLLTSLLNNSKSNETIINNNDILQA